MMAERHTHPSYSPALTGRVGLGLLLLLLLTGCSDTINGFFGGGEIEKGDEVVFNTMVPDVKSTTRSAMSVWKENVGAYKAVNREYTFSVEMWKKNATSVTATSTYKPIWTDKDGKITYNSDGTLQAAEDATPLYWQDNVNEWGFKATTVSSAEIEADQSDQEKWLHQDKLVGYGYLPIWTGGEDDGHETDNINQKNYRTSKQWYADNKRAKELSGLMVSSNEDYKKIPLYLQHQRSWVTIILKAGEGVTREALAYATSADNIKTTLYSYKEGETTPFEITKAWSSEEFINYDSDKNGAAATGVSTTRYDAIVEPHNFIENANTQEKDIIARISVSNQSFTIAAANDFKYHSFIAEGSEDKEAATQAMQAYNLEPGKHLTITATLSRASRMIKITAWIEDWTETVTQTICDDYGQNGNPTLINNRAELEDFLRDPDKNKAGNVGLIVPGEMSLAEGEVWSSNYDLKATLNLAGAKLTINKLLLKNIERTGSIVNGEIIVKDGFNEAAAVAQTNSGTIERVRVTTSGELTTARASKGGLVVDNFGTIYQCTSALPVYGNEAGYVGGIAATSLYPTDSGRIPVIEDCTVTARVDGNASVTAGGGIVGQAEGRVSNNTFEYGITLLQDVKYQNIIGSIGSNSSGLTLHSQNSWPTTERYTINGTEVEVVNSWTGQHYNAVVDNQLELKTLLTSAYNKNSSIYRLANSFTLNKDVDGKNWIWGNSRLDDKYFVTSATENYANGNVRFNLDGNHKTITLTGNTYATMLFGNILGEVYDLNLMLDKPIVADRIMDLTNTDVDTNGDAAAAFAYAVTGAGEIKGKITNITLRTSDLTNNYIQSSTPGGIVVWASHGGSIINCATNVNIKMNLVFKTGVTGFDTRRYAGGIVAIAERATVTQCRYYGGKGSIGWVTGNTHCQGHNCRYGGIVGGTSEISGSDTTPLLVLSDCSSWFELPTFGEDVAEGSRPRMGSLIGSTVYHDPTNNTVLYSAMAEENAGNWWTGTIGASYMKQGVTEEMAIGKKNSVTPSTKGW